MENKMTNQKRLEEYLVGNKEKNVLGYLKDTLSNGKVIMLSGKWGSGKTHFWKNVIVTEDFKKELKEKNKSYAYISLYGKNTIESIQNDLLYNSYEFIANPNEKVSKFFSVFTYYSQYSPEKISSGILKGITDLKNKFEFKKAESYLSDGGIICFDDFERKSKDIDLNDLFGFITQLTLNFDCKVVIILNDDVFEGEEKKIFSNVKEKSVSKFLKYEPSIQELFETIFSDKKYKILDIHRDIILKTIEETEELNARIYIQVLDNLVEWCDKKQEINDNVLRCLILVNVNFILYHKIVTSSIKQERVVYDNLDIKRYCIKNMENDAKFIKLFNDTMDISCSKKSIIKRLIDEVSQVRKEIYNQSVIDNSIKFINENHSNIYAINFATMFKFDENIFPEQLTKINNFIETGILINE